VLALFLISCPSTALELEATGEAKGEGDELPVLEGGEVLVLEGGELPVLERGEVLVLDRPSRE
jgi:hypothetical protein